MSPSSLAPPTVVHAAHDHVWLSWNAPQEIYGARLYDVFRRRLDEPSPTLALSQPAEQGTTARIDGLIAGEQYEFAVRAVMWLGDMHMSYPSKAMRTAAAADVLLLVGRMPPSKAEALLQRHLQGLGLLTHVAEENELPHDRPPADASQLVMWAAPLARRVGPRLLVVAPSCSGHLLQVWRQHSHSQGPLRLPVAALVLSSRAWQALRMVQPAYAPSGPHFRRGTAEATGDWAVVRPVRHSLRAELPAGRIALCVRGAAASRDGCMVGGQPAAGAVVIAHAADTPNWAIAFGFEGSGTEPADETRSEPVDETRSEPVDGRRADSTLPRPRERWPRLAALGVTAEGLGRLDAAGYALLSAAARWALHGPVRCPWPCTTLHVHLHARVHDT